MAKIEKFTVDIGDGLKFTALEINQSGESYIGYLTHESEKTAIGQTSLLKDFVDKTATPCR